MDNTENISIVIVTDNHLDNLKVCIESLYKFTNHFNFELITVNNGCDTVTKDYLSSLKNTKMVTFPYRVTMGKALNEATKYAEGEYIFFTGNNMIFTPNWLDNLITCFRSNEKVGIAVPACGLDFNFQEVKLSCNNINELYECTKNYNISDCRKWEERVKLYTYACLIRKELLSTFKGFNETDYYLLEYTGYDLSFRLRRAGYKLIFAGDTYIHHCGFDISINDSINQNIVDVDSKIFFTKFGIEPSIDSNINFELVNLVNYKKLKTVKILGIGSTCGDTVLQIKNYFKNRGIEDVEIWYISDIKTCIEDLNSIFEHVILGNAEKLSSIYGNNKFDLVLIEKELQFYNEPEILLEKLNKKLKKQGQILFSFDNEAYYTNIVKLISENNVEDRFTSKYCNKTNLGKALKKYGYDKISIYSVLEDTIPENLKYTKFFNEILPFNNNEDVKLSLETKKYIITAGMQKHSKNILLYPGYDHLMEDKFFDFDIIGEQLGIDVGKGAFGTLRDEFNSRGYNFHTIDNGNINNADYIIFIDLPKSYNSTFFKHIYNIVYQGNKYLNSCLELKGNRKPKLILFMQEPPFVMPENYDISMHEYFDIIFTVNDDMVDNIKYFKYFCSEPEKVTNIYSKTFKEKKLLTLIAAHKLSGVVGELYSKRKELIAYFENNYLDSFEFYGKGWEQYNFKSYKGSVSGKLEALSQYKFCICYENGIYNGWITEKIFDCFFSECVPIYLGAPNIAQYIPEDTFIDMRKFKDYEELYQYIISIKEEEYNNYLNNIKNFLSSSEYKKFTHRSFAKSIVNTICNNKALY